MFPRLLRDPLVLFLAAGAALYAAHAAVESRRAEPIRLTAATLAVRVADFVAVTGRQAGAQDLARIERELVTEELLYREALAEGLHLGDGAVRERLVGQMRLRITGLQAEPDDEALVNHYAGHLQLYMREAEISFEQVFFASQPADAAGVLEALRAGGEVSGDAARHGARFPRYGASMLRGLFGQSFTQALWEAPLGQWSGPVRSNEGWHFLRPSERLPAEPLPFATVREQVARDLLAARAADAVERHLSARAQRYEVVGER